MFSWVHQRKVSLWEEVGGSRALDERKLQFRFLSDVLWELMWKDDGRVELSWSEQELGAEWDLS